MSTRCYKVKDALLRITAHVHHYKAVGEKDKYFVWAEDGEGESLKADNKKLIEVTQGTIDYFTKSENDSNIVKVKEELEKENVSFFLHSVQHEEETGFIHYEWVWEV